MKGDTQSSSPGKLKTSGFTQRSVEIVDVVYRYRLLPTSLLLQLVEGNHDVTYRHLLRLHQASLLNRFSLPRQGGQGEFIYYLDNPKALDLLVGSGRYLHDDLDWESVKRNRDRDYSTGDTGDTRLGRFLFVEHELVISRFHFMLEISCRKSHGAVIMSRWKQGADLWDRALDGPSGQSHPHRPDAFFSLQFSSEPEESRFSHFFYEADRYFSNSTRTTEKMRSYFEFLTQRQHEGKYGIRKIRAVLVETTDAGWADALRDAALQADIDASTIPLFWFTTSEIFTHTNKAAAPRYMRDPGVILEPIWLSTTNEELFSLRK